MKNIIVDIVIKPRSFTTLYVDGYTPEGKEISILAKSVHIDKNIVIDLNDIVWNIRQFGKETDKLADVERRMTKLEDMHIARTEFELRQYQQKAKEYKKNGG